MAAQSNNAQFSVELFELSQDWTGMMQQWIHEMKLAIRAQRDQWRGSYKSGHMTSISGSRSPANYVRTHYASAYAAYRAHLPDSPVVDMLDKVLSFYQEINSGHFYSARNILQSIDIFPLSQSQDATELVQRIKYLDKEVQLEVTPMMLAAIQMLMESQGKEEGIVRRLLEFYNEIDMVVAKEGNEGKHIIELKAKFI